MLSFKINGDALGGGRPTAAERAALMALSQCLHSHGLVNLGASDVRTLLEKVSQLPPTARNLFERRYRKRVATFRPSLRVCDHPSVAVEITGRPDSTRACRQCAYTQTSIEEASYCHAVVETQKRDEMGVPAGSNGRNILFERVAHILTAARSLYIVDRYMTQDLQRFSERGRSDDSALVELLRACDSSGVKSAELVYVQRPRSSSSQRRRDRDFLSETLGGAKNSMALTLYEISPEEGSTFHDRWLGLGWSKDGSATWNIGSGMSQFDLESAPAVRAFSRANDEIAPDLCKMARSRSIHTIEL